ncbi:hypothetical protein KSP39_PZI015929 [Platanthera zijinensis]|uniref:Uncharacterized protein n=1 Tax=Platanthera zijinensis TaxID=2320716 RepID=A0AAP0B8G5_9ASPA
MGKTPKLLGLGLSRRSEIGKWISNLQILRVEWYYSDHNSGFKSLLPVEMLTTTLWLSMQSKTSAHS